MTTRPEQEEQPAGRSDAEGRESIWSVDAATKSAYFILFIVQVGAGVGIAAWDAFHEYDTLWDIWRFTWAASSPLIITSAAAAIVVTEIGGYLMVLSRGLRERVERMKQQRIAHERAQRAEERAQRAEGRAEGRAEVEARMEAWNNRRLDAERKGEPFDEPLPIRTKDG